MSAVGARPRFDGPRPRDKAVDCLVEARLSKGLSREALALMIGCSAKDLYRYEKGQSAARMATFIAWLEVLGGAIEWP